MSHEPSRADHAPLLEYATPSTLRAVAARIADRPGLAPGRILFASREIYRAVTPSGERELRLAGRLRADGPLPVVGDWVGVRPSDDGAGLVETVLPRRGVLSRGSAGEATREQVIAAWVDTVFLVMGLDADYNPRRFERLAVLARESGAQPVGVLTKSDLVPDPVAARLDLASSAPDVPLFAVSSTEGHGLEPLRTWLRPGETVALLGSSGAGKSTLINALCGAEIRRTGAVRAADGRGRHTTTERQLVRLPGGALLVDNPGIREVGLWAGEEALDGTFADVVELARACRFRDCAHDDEPGCAVRAAIGDGRLAPERLESWRKLGRELDHLELRRDEAARRAADRRTGKLYKRIQAEKRTRRGE